MHILASLKDTGRTAIVLDTGAVSRGSGGKESPIGLILCSEGNTEHIELLMIEGSDIKVAQYLTELPEKSVLQKQLYKAIETAKKNYKKNHINP